MGFKPRLSAEDIERFRQSGLRIDRQGEIWHEGESVKHLGIKRALLSWLDVLPDGRDIIRLDATRYTYVQVDDSHLLAQSLRWNERGEALCALNSGETQSLDLKTLSIGNGHAMYALAGKLKVRLLSAAYYVLAERIEEAGDTFEVSSAGARHPIAFD